MIRRIANGVARVANRGYDYSTRVIPQVAPPFVRNWLHSNRYENLTESQLLATRTSDTAFVFGSSYSLNEVSDEMWAEIAEHNTVSFREFPRQDFVRADYHLTAEVDELEPYARRIRENKRYVDTVFIVQQGWHAWNGNDLIGRGLLNPGSRVYRFYRTGRGLYQDPSFRPSDGLVHGYNSSISATNFAIAMGWKTIVLAGIDLYHKRYFWLPPDTTRTYEKDGITHTSRFPNTDRIVDYFRRWREVLEPRGCLLMVQNPESLLAEVLPVYAFGDERTANRQCRTHSSSSRNPESGETCLLKT